MRYNVHSPCTFHNRIAKYLGVLVGAALVATLGLPSAVQAQTPAAPTVTGTGDGTRSRRPGTITATWGSRLVALGRIRTGGWSNIQSLAYHGTTRDGAKDLDGPWMDGTAGS